MYPQKLIRLLSRCINRVTVTAVLVLLQALWITVSLLSLTQYAAWISASMLLLSLIAALLLIRKEENPAYTIAWLVVIGLLPLLGGILYLTLGSKRPSRRLGARLRAAAEQHKEELTQQPGQTENLEPRVRTLTRYLAQYGPYPAWTDTAAEYFPSGEQLFARMRGDLERAERFIFLEYFIISEGEMWETIFDILRRKAAQGVDVRLIYDDFGCISLPMDFLVRMERAHIRCIPFNPVIPVLSVSMNHRDHRKQLIVDGNVAYHGGVNLADEYINRISRFGYWKDVGIRLEGAAVWNCTMMFLNHWNAFRPGDTDYGIFRPTVLCPADGVVQPYGYTPLEHENVAENVYLDLIHQARDYLYIFTPYLAIGYELLTALELAARRGVDVRLVAPGIPDKKAVFRLTRSYYAPLLRAGVRVFEFTPGFLHAKVFVSDDAAATVGSVNMDYRSLYLHFECGTLLLHNSQIEGIRRDMLETMERSREIRLEDCQRTMRGKLADGVLRLLSPLL